MENQYLFASSQQWVKNGFTSVESILSLSENFQLISSSVQMQHLQEILFEENIIDVEILQDNPSPEDVAYISKSSPDFYRKYSLFNHAFLEALDVFLSVNVDDDSIADSLSERIEKNLPPFSKIGNMADSLSWIALLSSDKVPLGSMLYVYGSDDDFFLQRNIHPYLSHEWKYHKRGAISAYDPAVFTQRLNQNQKNEGNKVLSPKELFIYVDKLVNRTADNLQKPNPDLMKAREDLMKARSYLQNLENKVAPKMLIGLQKLFQETTEKCRALMNKNNIEF
ncbi:MAG: hypothetical protein ACRCY4_10265 [Brevinema sp.]